jgi:hypothetical protein
VLSRMKPNEQRKPTSTKKQPLAAVGDQLVLPEFRDEGGVNDHWGHRPGAARH